MRFAGNVRRCVCVCVCVFVCLFVCRFVFFVFFCSFFFALLIDSHTVFRYIGSQGRSGNDSAFPEQGMEICI